MQATSSFKHLKTRPTAFLTHCISPTLYINDVYIGIHQPNQINLNSSRYSRMHFQHSQFVFGRLFLWSSWSSFLPHELLPRFSFWSIDFIASSIDHFSSSSYHGSQLLLSGLIIIWCHMEILAWLCIGDWVWSFNTFALLYLCLLTSLEFWKTTFISVY